MRYVFSMVSCDPTTHVLPYWDTVEADTFERAVTLFAQAHGLVIHWDSTDGNQAWFRTSDGRDAQYAVSPKNK